MLKRSPLTLEALEGLSHLALVLRPPAAPLRQVLRSSPRPHFSEMEGPILVFWGCYRKVTNTGWPRTVGLWSLSHRSASRSP